MNTYQTAVIYEDAYTAGWNATMRNAESEAERYLAYAKIADADPDFWFGEELVIPAEYDDDSYALGALSALDDIL